MFSNMWKKVKQSANYNIFWIFFNFSISIKKRCTIFHVYIFLISMKKKLICIFLFVNQQFRNGNLVR